MPILSSLKKHLHRPDQVELEHEGDTNETLLSFFIKLEENENLVSEAETLLTELSHVIIFISLLFI